MKNLRRIVLGAFLALISGMFMSCFSMKQSLSYEKGNYSYTVELAVDKMVLALAEMDADTLFAQFDNELAKKGGISDENVKVEKIDTEKDAGFKISVVVNEDTEVESEKAVIPVKNGKKLEILIFGGQAVDGTVDFNSDEGAQAREMLAESTWTYSVHKSVMKKVKKAAIVDEKNGKEFNCEVNKDGDNFVITIPLTEILQVGNSYSKLVISK